MNQFRDVMEVIGTCVDAAGVLLVVIGATIATGRYVAAAIRSPTEGTFRRYRQDLGRAILLGLEFLVAGDIIKTVVVAPTLQNVIVLGLIVMIRTFLSMALELELEGRWPWQKAVAPPAAGLAATDSRPRVPSGAA